MEYLIGLVVIASALFVYYDATKNKVGKIPDERGFLNMSPSLWALSILLLWIIVFPLYLINRSKLIMKAKEKPQYTSDIRNNVVFGGLAVLFFLVLIMALMNIFLPSNSSKSNIEDSTIPTVTQILQNQLGAAGVECVEVDITEEFAQDCYKAIATLNTAKQLNITIQVKEDQIFVTILNE